MRIGAHESVAGGLERGIFAAWRDGCEAVQIFTRNQNQWHARPLEDEAVERFQAAVRRCKMPRDCLMAHDSYLINLAAPDPSLRRRSLEALTDELRRCTRLGIRYLVMHPGAHVGQGEARGLRRISRGIARALQESEEGSDSTWLLIETTAGQGTTLGHRFEHIRDLLAGVGDTHRLGVCVDTCHLHAAGYDLVSDSGYERTLCEFDRIVGLEHVRGFHLNDAKREFGSRVDRHERIGQGTLGREPFRRLVNDARFATIPGVLELPPPYPPLLARLRRLADGSATARRRPAPPPRSALARFAWARRSGREAGLARARRASTKGTSP